MRMIVAGGGTGGHLFPGLAVANLLAEKYSGSVLFVGSSHGIEARVIPKTSFPFEALPTQAARGRGIRGMLRFAFSFPPILRQARQLIRTFQPDVVLGLGGYSSVPMVVAAWRQQVPCVLMEQNTHPGMANRLLAHLAQRVCVTFSESAKFLPTGKTVHTGNPVRQLSTTAYPAPERFTVLAFGGSQGAHQINRAMVDAAQRLSTRLTHLQIVHQTGPSDEGWVRQQYEGAGTQATVLPFIDEMGQAYGRADVVVCRAGASTLAELAMLGKPAILVPYPYAADDHQRHNATVFVRHGAAEMILDADLTGEALASRLATLARAPEQRRKMSAAAQRLATPNAAADVLDTCRQVVQAARVEQR